MKGILVRIGIDQAYGNWNAPMNPITNEFVYVPINEKITTDFEKGLDTSYSSILPTLENFVSENHLDLYEDLKFPKKLHDYKMHLDPDFDYLTYGDRLPRGKNMINLEKDDFLIFYAGLKPIIKWKHKLVYAIIGIYFFDSIMYSKNIPKYKWRENAHTRKLIKNDEDIIIKAKSKNSGRLKRCIPIGEWRNRSYRVKKELLDEWGDLSVKDGFIQRSAVPPLFKDPEKFYSWFIKQNVSVMRSNN